MSMHTYCNQDVPETQQDKLFRVVLWMFVNVNARLAGQSAGVSPFLRLVVSNVRRVLSGTYERNAS